MGIEQPKIDPNYGSITNITNYGKTNIANWLKNGLSKDSVVFCENFGYCISRYEERNDPKKRSKPLSTNQIRNIYGEIKRIEMSLGSSPRAENWKKVESKVLLLKPKMAYSAKRDKTIPAECLYEILKAAIEAIESVPLDANKIDYFLNFAKIFEAIIAYHRAFEQKQ